MGFTLHLLTLDCHASQEMDGDEIYMKLNDKIIFSWKGMGRKFSDSIKNSKLVDQYDFRIAKARAVEGMVPGDYQPSDFVIQTDDASLKIELWESDEGEFMRGEDDFLGEIIVYADEASQNEVTKVFQRKEVDYQLTYRVTTN